jgi:hypothetical protein
MMTEAVATDPRVPGRDCGSCTLCCKLLGVTDLEKPRGQWCRHCEIGRGCRIYDTRPAGCREFFCGWLVDPRLSEAWRPADSKIVVLVEGGGKRIIAYVDPDRPAAWRREPFYSTLKRWSAAALRHGGTVAVSLGQKRIVVLPDRDVDLGALAEDEVIATRERRSAAGLTYDVFKLKRDDPRLAGPAPEK